MKKSKCPICYIKNIKCVQECLNCPYKICRKCGDQVDKCPFCRYNYNIFSELPFSGVEIPIPEIYGSYISFIARDNISGRELPIYSVTDHSGNYLFGNRPISEMNLRPSVSLRVTAFSMIS